MLNASWQGSTSDDLRSDNTGIGMGATYDVVAKEEKYTYQKWRKGYDGKAEKAQ